MNMLEHFQLKPDYGYYCPVKTVSLQEAIDLVSSAIAFCADQQIRKLLVNAAGLTGFEPPAVSDRFFLASQFARAAKGRVSVALVVRPELIHPEKFGVVVARNRGLMADVFASEAEAETWLLTFDLR